MQIGGKDHPRDEGPGLLGIPAPVATPRILGPDRPGNDREGPQREGERNDPIGHDLQSLLRGHPLGESGDLGTCRLVLGPAAKQGES